MTDSPNEYVLDPCTEESAAQIDHVVESVKNAIATLNAIFADRARSGRSLSGESSFDAVPGTQVLTARQYGVLKVRVWERWQTGLLQSLFVGRPIVYESSLYSSDPADVDMRENGDERPHVSLIYFGDEFTLEEDDGEVIIEFEHTRTGFDPEARIEDCEDTPEVVQGVELRAYDNGELSVVLMGGTEEDDDYAWWPKTVDGEVTGERNERLQSLHSADDQDEFAHEFEQTVQFLVEEETEEEADGLSSVMNMLIVSEGVSETAELTHTYSPLRKAMARGLGLKIYETNTSSIRSVMCADEDVQQRVSALDRAVVECEESERVERVLGWMLSLPDDAIRFNLQSDLTSEQSMIHVINQMERRNIDPEEAKYLLLLPYHYDASDPEAIQRCIDLGKEIAEAVEDFDDKHGTDLVHSVLHPAWAYRADVYSIEEFERVLAGEDVFEDREYDLI